MLEALTLSDVLGYTSITCWLGAQFPQVLENIKRQSCEGLALPFLANWLMGDISNLVGCILTHQLPFQTYLATYFVCVDLMLVVQYYYYYQPSKVSLSTLGHIRSGTSPSVARRMSIDRGASRYRTLSALASNMAAAAALVVQQDEQRGSRHLRGHTYEPSNIATSSKVPEGDGDLEDADIPAPMLESFHSEGGRERSRKRVSWSIERHRNRAGSVGQNARPTPTITLHLSPEQSAASIRDPDPPNRNSHDEAALLSSTESLTPNLSSTRGSRASRRGSTMLFLGIWTLFGIGNLPSLGNPSLHNAASVGQVLSPQFRYPPTSTHTPSTFNAALYVRDILGSEKGPYPIEFANVTIPIDANETMFEDPSDEPSSEQVLGRIFAWLCTTLYLTSRLPQIWKNYVRKSVEGLSMYLFVFAFLGNVFYVSSILLSPKRLLPPPESTKFIKESIPYLLGSGGTLMFDITIVTQSFLYRPRPRRHASTHTRIFDDEERGLLTGDNDTAILNRGRTSRSQRDSA